MPSPLNVVRVEQATPYRVMVARIVPLTLDHVDILPERMRRKARYQESDRLGMIVSQTPSLPYTTNAAFRQIASN